MSATPGDLDGREGAGARIAVFGTGSIGGWLGGRLAGHARVALVARPQVADDISTNGLTLTAFDGWQRRVSPGEVEVVTSAEAVSNARLVLVTVKSAATAQAGRELARHLRPGTLVISFQNGLRNARMLAAELPDCTVLAGMVPYNVVRLGPGRWHQGTSGRLMVAAHAQLAAFLPLFEAAGLPLQPRGDIAAVQAGKLLLNLNNAINALADIPLREQLAQRGWRCCLALAQVEALRVFAAAGIAPARVTPLPPTWLPALLRLPDALFTRLAARMLRIDPLARSSMWEDLAAGRPTEVDWIQGEIVALGGHHGLATPVNARLVQLVHEAGRQRRAWTAAALLADLEAAAMMA